MRREAVTREAVSGYKKRGNRKRCYRRSEEDMRQEERRDNEIVCTCGWSHFNWSSRGECWRFASIWDDFLGGEITHQLSGDLMKSLLSQSSSAALELEEKIW